MTSMLEQGHSINKAKSLANHHPKVSEQMSEIALARVLALIEIKKKYDLPKKEIKRLKKFVMTNINSMRTDEISQQLTNVGWEHRIIDPFVQAYSHEIKKRNFVGHKVFQISKKLSRSKIKTNRKISVRDLESLKRYIHYHPAKNAEMKDIVDQLIQDGERGEIPISNNQP